MRAPLQTVHANRARTGATVARPDDWRARAACAERTPDGYPLNDPELWQPISATQLVQIREAKTICRGCPVTRACYDTAIADGLQAQHGIWAGLTEDERRSILRRQQRQDRAEAAS